MILRRVIEHVKAQNWTAVVLDFVIVVLGVFVGLQVSNWNEGRKAAADEGTTLSRLHAEAEEIVAYFQDFVASNGERIALDEAAVAALFGGGGAEMPHDKFNYGLMGLIFYPTIAPNHAVYDELVAAGLADSISDPEVRAAVSAYYAELDWARGQLEFFRVGNDRLLAAAADGFITDYDPSSDDRVSVRFDAQALKENRAFKTLAAGALRNQLVTQLYRVRLLEKSEAMCRELARASGLPCALLEKKEQTP